MARVYNFAPGPAALPLPVLQKAQKELVEYGSSGMSVMEMSHRGGAYEEIHKKAEETLRRLMGIPANYRVLFVQGGATTQFSAVPMNLMRKGRADYVESGNFAANAIKEAARYGQVNVAASSKAVNYVRVPELDKAKFDPNADYFHITTNNTIFGTRYTALPDTGNVPLVADMSSNILGEVYDITKFGLVYGGAQKNMGIAGLTVVVVREDLIGYARPETPQMLNYKVMADSSSLHNTPPCFAVYMAGLVFEWLEALGGVPAIQKINEQKAKLLYDFLDGSKLFSPTAEKAFRSIMNVTYVLPSDELTAEFVKFAASRGLVNIKGHRLVGGIRASIYNAMPVEGVQALVDCMKAFEVDRRG
jgi:phosphoserine aminotransferase